MTRLERGAWIAGLLVLAIPLFLSGYLRYVATLWMIYAIAAVGLQIPIGLSQIYSFGHSAFMLIGAYGTALAMLHGGWPIPLAMLASAVLAGVVGALLALPSLRLSGFALAIVTMGAASLFFQSVKVFALTGGPQGLFLPEIATVKAADGRVFYAIAAALLVCGLVVSACVERGRLGRALRAAAVNPLMAQSFGVHLIRTRTLAFVLSAVYGAVAGALLGLVSGYIAPEAYSPELSIQVFAAVMIGGAARFWGPVLGALFIVAIPELTQSVQNLGAIVYSLLFIAIATLYPGGLQRAITRLAGTARMTMLLEAKGIAVRFGGVAALQGVDLAVESGRVHGLIGPNGAGKTTLLNCIGRLIRPTEGTLRFGDGDLLARPAHDLAAIGIARTFQNLALIDGATVLDNVRVGLLRRDRVRLADLLPTPARRREEARDREAALGALDRIGLGEHANTPVRSLPYGIRKSVEIARALCAAPRMLMLDEPTAGLNAGEMTHLAGVVRRLRDELGLTVLLITHHIDFLLRVADRVTVLDLGRVIADGEPALVRHDARVRAAYVGERGVTTAREPLLAIDALDVHYGAAQAVAGVSLSIGAGEVVAVVGANGAGKTTLLRTISGLMRATSGRMRFADRDIGRETVHGIVRLGVSHIPEGRGMLPTLTVRENLTLGAHVRKRPDPAVLARVDAWFPVLAARGQPAGMLSGGEQQMLAIARAMLAEPRLLLIDELSLGLSPKVTAELVPRLRDLRDSGTSVLVVDQNIEQTLRVADRLYVLANGRIVLESTPDAFRESPDLMSRYLGVELAD